MIAPWYSGEDPVEDGDGVLHYFMASLDAIDPHSDADGANRTEHDIGWPRDYAWMHTFLRHRRHRGHRDDYALAHRWECRAFAKHYIDDPVAGLRLLVDLRHNAEQSSRVDRLGYWSEIRHYDPNDVTVTFRGQVLVGVDAGRLIIDDPRGPEPGEDP